MDTIYKDEIIEDLTIDVLDRTLSRREQSAIHHGSMLVRVGGPDGLLDVVVVAVTSDTDGTPDEVTDEGEAMEIATDWYREKHGYEDDDDLGSLGISVIEIKRVVVRALVIPPLPGTEVWQRAGGGVDVTIPMDERQRVIKGEKLEACADGGYPWIYYVDEGEPLCRDCATDVLLGKVNGERLIRGIYWEGPVEYCCNCNAEIESAYGDPDEA